MIMCDITSVNSGKCNGVVVRLQNFIESFGFEKPQYVGCQNHVLDRILRLGLDSELGETSKTPLIFYLIMEDVLKNMMHSNKQHFISMTKNMDGGMT